MTEKHFVYLDHAAATALDLQVKAAMEPYFWDWYGNPSALYGLGRAAREALDNARDSVARVLGCTAAEIVFTGSGTESDNLAIFGIALGYAGRGRHIITTNFEHHAVLNPCLELENEGYEVSRLKVDHGGLIASEQLKAAIRASTLLISIMYANNEVGTIEPIVELARTVWQWKKEHGRKDNEPPFFHTDACQAAGYLDMNVNPSTGGLGVDLMTINGSKIYGPKGVGVLYVRRGVRLKPLIYGGGQEFGLRSGTENVAGIVGVSKALEIAQRLRDEETKRSSGLRDQLIAGILGQIPRAELNGHPIKRLPNNVNVFIPGIEAEAMLFYLDEAGIAAAAGSACESVGPDPSHVVQALGKSREAPRSSVRFTLGRSTAEADIDYVLGKLVGIVQKLRKAVP